MATPLVDVGGPCGWTAVYLCDTDAIDGLDAVVRDAVEAWAAEVLWRRTGRIYGECPTSVRPCRDDCPRLSAGGPWPTRTDVGWTNVGGCGCAGPCGCGGPAAQVTLPGPIGSVTAVWVDGAALPADAVRVDNWTTVVRQDGGTWPACQHMGDPAPGGWQVDYLYGLPVPDGGRVAYGALAAELAKACAGGPCRLPRAATNVARQGVTVTLPPPDLLADGTTGIPEVDMWVSSVQPDVMSSAGGAPWSPDLPPLRLQTWPRP